jgi:hypothetical protein
MTALVLTYAFPVGASAQQAATATSASSLVFDGVTVVDVEQGKLVPDQRVVIAGNRIKAVGSSRLKLPTGAQVVDARGKYLIPGLWDLHTHTDTMASSFYPLFIATGVTGIRDAYAFISTETQVRWWREILAGARVGPPRQLLAGQWPSKDYADMVAHQAAGANFLKLYPYTSSKAAAARRVGLPFGGHVARSVSAIEASDSGMRILDHADAAGGLDTMCGGTTATVEQCERVAQVLQRNGTWWVPTLSQNNEAIMYPKQMLASRPILGRQAQIVKAFWKGSPLPHSGNWLRELAIIDAPRPLRPDSSGFLRLAQRVGIPILAGTDIGAPALRRRLPGFSLHTELAVLVVEGLTPLNALQSATLNPAKMLRATDSLGTVAPGKLADLVLLDADPLADITNTTTIRAVVANGRYFDRAALDALLDEVQADPSTLIQCTAKMSDAECEQRKAEVRRMRTPSP